jgi:hypothetical protein
MIFCKHCQFAIELCALRVSYWGFGGPPVRGQLAIIRCCSLALLLGCLLAFAACDEGGLEESAVQSSPASPESDESFRGRR